MKAVDLFAGPGGWDVGARELGLDPLGIELDDAACRVREAAGLRTVQGDVAALDPLDFPCELLIASPPCTAFSMAGKGEGRGATADLTEAIGAMGRGEPVDQVALDEACADSTAHLVLEPLRWALALDPATVCCEQVPPVLPLWEAMAAVLRRRGYFTWTGIVSSERYGVPQTRKRAFLIASKDHHVGEPKGTHQRYVGPRNRDDDGGGLFDLPESQRVVAKGDEHLTPWVSMAEALGWGMTERPYLAIASSRTTGGPDKEKVGGSGARETIYAEQEAGRWVGERPATAVMGDPRIAPPGYRGGKADYQDGGRPDSMFTPNGWTEVRPATTVAGDPRIFPGPRTERNHDYQPGDGPVSQANDGHAIRVTEAQAACLQGFPEGYPWAAAGSRSAAFRCIGNAVPPPMAQAVLTEALRLNRLEDAA